MDLGAYMQIDDLMQLAKDNGIEVPRLRGYRLMKDEEPMSEEDIKEMERHNEIYVTENLCRSKPFWDHKSHSCCFSSYTDYLCDYYLSKDSSGEYDGIRWDRIHGWKRRVLKFEIKKEKKLIRKQYELWNKYAGREDVLYIHARIGGYNWSYFGGPTKVANQPWFLDRVDDYLDGTYCDIYARIGGK